MRAGQQLEVVATDAGSARDIPAYIGMSSHRLVSQLEDHGEFHFVIECGG